MAHLGFIIVPTGYADGVMFTGAGSPYGASVVSGNPPAGPTAGRTGRGALSGHAASTQIAKKLFA